MGCTSCFFPFPQAAITVGCATCSEGHVVLLDKLGFKSYTSKVIGCATCSEGHVVLLDKLGFKSFTS